MAAGIRFEDGGGQKVHTNDKQSAEPLCLKIKSKHGGDPVLVFPLQYKMDGGALRALHALALLKSLEEYIVCTGGRLLQLSLRIYEYPCPSYTPCYAGRSDRSTFWMQRGQQRSSIWLHVQPISFSSISACAFIIDALLQGFSPQALAGCLIILLPSLRFLTIDYVSSKFPPILKIFLLHHSDRVSRSSSRAIDAQHRVMPSGRRRTSTRT